MMLFTDDPPFQLNQAANENGPVPKFKLAGFPILTLPLSNLNAVPTFPTTKAAPPETVPLLPLVLSDAFPSALHQLTNPEGGGTQLCPGGGGGGGGGPPP